MTAGELLQLFRFEFADTEQPYLVSDEVALSYINDAQQMFCRLCWGIASARGNSLRLRSGKPWYELPEGTLDVSDAWYGGRLLTVLPAGRMHEYGLSLGDTRGGQPRFVVLGLDAGYARLFPEPDASCDGTTVELHIYRLPTVIEDKGDELEIEPQHHRHLLMWVKSLAFGALDADVYDPNKSAEFEARFKEYCKQAALERTRATHPPGYVAYGGL